MSSIDANIIDVEEPAVTVDAEELARIRQRKLESIGKWALPLGIMVFAIFMWDRICVWNEIPRYILPRPYEVMATLWEDWAMLTSSLWVNRTDSPTPPTTARTSDRPVILSVTQSDDVSIAQSSQSVAI
ncbi:MAG: hypothetical protein AAFO77_15075, partial [Pseudomonadota bacterium]